MGYIYIYLGSSELGSHKKKQKKVVYIQGHASVTGSVQGKRERQGTPRSQLAQSQFP